MQLAHRRVCQAAGQAAIRHHALHVQILDTDHLVLANQRRGPFVREVGPSISDLTVELATLATACRQVFRSAHATKPTGSRFAARRDVTLAVVGVRDSSDAVFQMRSLLRRMFGIAYKIPNRPGVYFLHSTRTRASFMNLTNALCVLGAILAITLYLEGADNNASASYQLVLVVPTGEGDHQVVRQSVNPGRAFDISNIASGSTAGQLSGDEYHVRGHWTGDSAVLLVISYARIHEYVDAPDGAMKPKIRMREDTLSIELTNKVDDLVPAPGGDPRAYLVSAL